jgi:hypothetical protein
MKFYNPFKVRKHIDQLEQEIALLRSDIKDLVLVEDLDRAINVRLKYRKQFSEEEDFRQELSNIGTNVFVNPDDIKEIK